MLQLISKYRTPLMGFAILWIVIFHAGLQEYPPFIPFGFLLFSGYGGVDIFFFLSGFGLYYSSLKKESLSQYYTKRLLRVLPAFVLAILIKNALFDGLSLSHILIDLSTFRFWTENDLSFWFIPSILVVYLIFPYYIKVFNKLPNITTLCAILLGGIPILFADTMDFQLNVALFIGRIPIFAIGVLFGKLTVENVEMSKPTLKIIYLLGFLSACVLCTLMVHCNYPDSLEFGGSWFPFIFITPALVFLLVQSFEKLKNWRFVEKTFTFFGKYSLELYLVHSIVFRFRDIILNEKSTGADHLVVTGCVLVASLLILFPFCFLVNMVTNFASRRLLKS